MKICLAVLVSLLGLAAAGVNNDDPAVGTKIEGLVIEADFEPEGRKRFSLIIIYIIIYNYIYY